MNLGLSFYSHILMTNIMDSMKNIKRVRARQAAGAGGKTSLPLPAQETTKHITKNN